MVSKKKKIGLCLVFAVVLAFGLAIHGNVILLPFERSSEARLFDGLDDDRVLVGASHIVFVGKVIKKSGQTPGEAGPLTQFEVQVVQNIKGNLTDTVTMNQEGGYENGILSLVENQPLLIPGTTYLLSARTDGKGNYLVLPFARGRLVVSTDASLTKEQLISVAAKDQNVLALQEAYVHEIPLQVDVNNGNAWNSYTSKQVR